MQASVLGSVDISIITRYSINDGICIGSSIIFAPIIRLCVKSPNRKISFMKFSFQIHHHLTLSHAANKWKSLNHEISQEKKLDPRNTDQKKFWTLEIYTKNVSTHKIPTRKVSDSWNPREKKFGTHKIPTRKTFGPTKYPWEKILDPQIPTRAHGTRPTMVHEPQTWHFFLRYCVIAVSLWNTTFLYYYVKFCKRILKVEQILWGQ